MQTQRRFCFTVYIHEIVKTNHLYKRKMVKTVENQQTNLQILKFREERMFTKTSFSTLEVMLLEKFILHFSEILTHNFWCFLQTFYFILKLLLTKSYIIN